MAASTITSTFLLTLLLAAPAFGHVDGARPHLHTEQGVVHLQWPVHILGAAGILLAAALLRRASRRSIRS